MEFLYSESHVEIYRSIIEFNPDAIFVLGVDGTIMAVNKATTEILGYSEDEIQGFSCRERIFSRHARLFERYFNAALRGISSDYESEALHKNGQIVNLAIKLIPLNIGEEIVGVFSVARNITKQRQLEQSLKESNERYKRLVESSPEPIIVYQNEYIEYANPACIKLFGGSSLEEVKGNSIKNYFDPESVRLVENRIHQVEKVGEVFEAVEEKVIRPNGTVVDIEVTGITIGQNGKPSFLMFYHDITQRKRVEEALRQSQTNYRLIAENMTDLVCVVDREGTFKFVSPSHATVLGFPSEDYEGKPTRNWIHKDDLSRVQKQLDDAFQTKRSTAYEFRFRDIHGNWIWFEGKAIPVFDDKDDFEHFLVVSREVTERKIFEARLNHMAYHDPLTGVSNRRLFDERLEQTIKEAHRYDRKMAILFIDMDDFKKINDTLGHHVGDELLQQFAQRAQRCLRESDTLARLGGDEFTVLLPEIEDEQDAIQVAERIRACFLEEPWHIGEHVFSTTASIGVSLYPDDGSTSHGLLRSADEALYQAKEYGKNTFIRANMED